MDNSYLADLLFPEITKTPEYYENLYKKRVLPENAKVTRFAPSPTGFIHLGGLFAALVNERLAHQSGGVFYLRIEDTDKKREIEGGTSLIIDGLSGFGIKFDEGPSISGDYAPYIQSERREIYRTYVKDLCKKGLCYPCFCNEEKLSEIRKEQEEKKLLPGYYGSFAACRDLPIEEIEKRIKNGESYVVRLKSGGDASRRAEFHDGIKGDISIPENSIDIVLLKSDGMPTYHFAHAIDDHLMGTTDVIRGDEWISSVPIHLQLFSYLGFKAPAYSHISPIMKEENGGKRKLSKRKDPEAAVSYFIECGYPKESVISYLLNLINNNFEEYMAQNPDKSYLDFPVSLSNMSVSGCLFDLDKLSDLSKNIIAGFSADKVLCELLAYAKTYDPEFYSLLCADKDKALAILSIGRGGEKPRKDLSKMSDAKDYMGFFYDEYFTPFCGELSDNLKEDAPEIIDRFISTYSPCDDGSAWFDKVKEISRDLGYAEKPKDYKKDPASFRGHVGDVSMVLRCGITGKQNSPDLCECMKILGKEKSFERLLDFKRRI